MKRIYEKKNKYDTLYEIQEKLPIKLATPPRLYGYDAPQYKSTQMIWTTIQTYATLKDAEEAFELITEE